MSTEHRLTVSTPDPLAEITVHDGAFREVGRAVGYYDHGHPAGLYEIAVRTGGAVETRLVSLDRDRAESLAPVRFQSPGPANRAKGAEDWDRIAAEFANRPPQQLGPAGGAGLFILVRDRPGRAHGAGSPATGLSLRGPGLAGAIDLAAMPLDTSGRVSIASFEVAPGAWHLRLTLPDGTTRERALVASPGWTTQCFIVRRPFRAGPGPDLDHGVVSLFHDRAFRPDIERARVAETARDALANNRKVADAALNALMNMKFEDPMLGLLVAHLLLRDRPDHGALPAVLDNLGGMLGVDHPDVRALRLGGPLETPGPIAGMPMLRASWDRIVRFSIDVPDLVAPGTPLADLADRLLPSQPWLVWESPDSPRRRGDPKLDALGAWLRSADEDSGRESADKGGPALESFGNIDPDAASAPTVALDEEDRKELAMSLGVPAGVLDEMLAKLGR